MFPVAKFKFQNLDVSKTFLRMTCQGGLENCHSVVLVNNCSMQIDVQGLQVMRLEFLPIVTAIMQPLGQSAIKNLYRRAMIQHITCTMKAA